MSINGLRNPASAVTPPPHAALEADARTPAAGMIDMHRTALPDRPPQQVGEAATSPRVVLAQLGAHRAEPSEGALGDAAQTIAAKVMSELDSGKLALSASHSAGSLRAAASVAAAGVMKFRNELALRG